MSEWSRDDLIEGLRSFSGTDTRERFYEACAKEIEKASVEIMEDDNVFFEMRDAMQEFVDRCERGEVLSKYTCAKFKKILERAG